MKLRVIFIGITAVTCAAALIISMSGCSSTAGQKPSSSKSQAFSQTVKTDPSRQQDKTVQDNVPASQVKKVVMESKLLKRNMNLNIYLPKGYSTEKKYPVLYMIHGYSNNQNAWIDMGINKKADELIEKNKIKPLIIVMPDIDNSYGINSSVEPGVKGGNDQGMYEDYICKEIVSYVDANYSTDTSRDNRYIGGLSMGGFVALHLGLAHTDLFSRVGGHSPAVWVDTQKDSTAVYMTKWLYPDKKQRNLRDPLILAENKDLSKTAVYLDCGNQDGYRFFEGCLKLYSILNSKGVNVQLHLAPGKHDSAYWMSNLENYLLFYAGV
ncbi:MAG: alpha/beta hydrolase-fold protein [Bacillota bacterium]|nr:alpha/beta hydrolase-fold protein [Bacillota bacterium]